MPLPGHIRAAALLLTWRAAITAALVCWMAGAGLAADGAPTRRRPADDRPRHDDAALRELGILKYESERLVLYSDIDPAIARTLPALVDAAWPAWVDYFGAPPPAEDGSDFQLTGYLMKDRGLFLDAGLLPEELVDFQHGRHRGYQFWMAEQKFDYYRRHLLIHEATHCFMMIEPQLVRPPLFYLEGMAELFGTHDLHKDGSVDFRVMPADPTEEVGFGRIEMIQQEAADGRERSFDDVLRLSAEEFTRSRSSPYAWSWALCKFLDTHPRYRERFRKLAGFRDGREFRRSFDELFASDRRRLEIEWRLFQRTIEYGYDIERSAIDFAPGQPLADLAQRELNVVADRGWQCTGVLLSAGERCRVRGVGRLTLAKVPKPWVSEPQGVTIRYSAGLPIGRLTAIVLPDLAEAKSADQTPSAVIDIGSEATFESPSGGVLYLRVNDAWDSLADNSGAYRVSVGR